MWFFHHTGTLKSTIQKKRMRPAMLVLYFNTRSQPATLREWCCWSPMWPLTAKVVNLFFLFPTLGMVTMGSLDCWNYIELHAWGSLIRIHSATLFQGGSWFNLFHLTSMVFSHRGVPTKTHSSPASDAVPCNKVTSPFQHCEYGPCIPRRHHGASS